MDLIEELERFRFTRMEARIYVALVRHGQLNGSQIARELKANRSSVYTALNHLSERGAVFVVAGEPTEYVPVEPMVLVRRYQQEYERSLDFLESELTASRQQGQNHQYYNLRGRRQCLQKINEVVSAAKKEICFNLGIDFRLIDAELRDAARRGVRLIAFSFQPIPEPDYRMEVYHSSKFDFRDAPDRRILMVSDMEHGVIAGGNETRGYVGTYSTDPLFNAIIAEHIHHDIYLYRLEERMKQNLIDEQVKIGSLLERNFDAWMAYAGGQGASGATSADKRSSGRDANTGNTESLP